MHDEDEKFFSPIELADTLMEMTSAVFLTPSLCRETEEQRRARQKRWRSPKSNEAAGRVVFSKDPARRGRLGKILELIPVLDELEQESDTGGRLALRIALTIALELLRRLPAEELNVQEVFDQLQLLEQQLQNLDSGEVASALRPAPRARCRPRKEIEWDFKMRCILASKALTATGTPAAQADSIVFEHAKAAAKKVYKERRSYEFAPKTIARWRKNFVALEKSWKKKEAREKKLVSWEEKSKEQQVFEHSYESAEVHGRLEEFAQITLHSLNAENVEKPLGVVGRRVFRAPR